MQSERRSVLGHRVRLGLLLTAALGLATLGCGSPDSEAHRPDLETRAAPAAVAGQGGPLAPSLSGAMLMAADASFQLADDGTTRVTPDGISLTTAVRYFEPLQSDNWTAPDECSFNTMVGVSIDGTIEVPSVPFEGPSAQTDDDEGLLGAVVPLTHEDAAEPRSLVLVVAFGHEQVITITLPDTPQDPQPSASSTPDDSSTSAATLPDAPEPPVDAEPSAAPPALDTQPLDGWTALALVADPDPGPLAVEVTRTATDGSQVVESVEVPPVEQDGLAVLRADWVFDESAVGPQCEPPPGAPPVNTTMPPETDLFGNTVTPKPALPEPGEPPANAPDATRQVLEAIGAVYDIDDVYDEAKAALIEDPATGLSIIREIRANQVIEPFIGALDPEFDSVTFINPTQARVLYRVGPGYQWSIGRVDLIDGRWRVMLGTLCRDLAAAAYTCPGIAQDPPPGPLG